MRQTMASDPAHILSAAGARVGGERFGAALLEGLGTAANIDFIALVTHRPGEGPRMLSVASRRDLDQAMGLTRAYVEQGYVHDPNHGHLKRRGQCRKPLLLRHDERRLVEPHYRDYFFTAPGIVDKLSYLWCGGNTAYYLNLYRRQASGPFSPEEAGALDAMASVLVPLVQKHDARARLDAAMARGDQRCIAAELVGLLDAALTPREEAVLARIVSGVSTEGIALDLDVKPSTVITLRKRGYAKLGIATQAELFAHCLQALPKAYAPVTLQ